MVKWVIAATSVFFLFPLNASMAAGELDKFVICNDSGLYEQPRRMALAKNIASAFKAMAARIPVVTDEEELWLKTEIDDTLAASGGKPTIRAVKAEKSPAYAKRHAKVITDHVVAVTEDISAGQTTVSDEMKAWVSLQSAMFDYRYSDYLTVLLDAKILTPPDVPMIVRGERFDENNKVSTRCLIYTIVNELPP